MSDIIRVAIMEYDSLARQGVKCQLEGKSDLLLVGETRTGEGLFPLLDSTQPDVLIFGVHVPQSQRLPLIPLCVVAALEVMGRDYPQVSVILLARRYFPWAEETLERVDGYILRHDFLALDMVAAVRTVHKGGTFYSETARHEMLQPIQMGRMYKLDEAQVAILSLLVVAPHIHARRHAEALGMSDAIYQMHLQRALRALRVTDRLSAVLRALQMGILRIEDF